MLANITTDDVTHRHSPWFVRNAHPKHPQIFAGRSSESLILSDCFSTNYRMASHGDSSTFNYRRYFCELTHRAIGYGQRVLNRSTRQTVFELFHGIREIHTRQRVKLNLRFYCSIDTHSYTRRHTIEMRNDILAKLNYHFPNWWVYSVDSIWLSIRYVHPHAISFGGPIGIIVAHKQLTTAYWRHIRNWNAISK